jgi:Holliday junction resolvasome RuvABC endonuclease subunit
LATPKEITAQRRNHADRNCDIRIPRLFKHIGDAVRDFKVQMIVFEDVRFIKTVAQGQLWSSLRSCVWLQSSGDGLYEVKMRAVPVQTLKKFATGWANASKEQMIEAAIRDLPGDRVVKKFDDNQADALHLLNYGLSNLS